MTQNLSAELKLRLSRGLYPADLDPIIALTEEYAWQADRPLGLFVLGRILRLVERRWDPEDDQSGPSRKLADAMEQALMPALVAYLDAEAVGEDDGYEHLNALVRQFLAWEAQRP